MHDDTSLLRKARAKSKSDSLRRLFSLGLLSFKMLAVMEIFSKYQFLFCFRHVGTPSQLDKRRVILKLVANRDLLHNFTRSGKIRALQHWVSTRFILPSLAHPLATAQYATCNCVRTVFKILRPACINRVASHGCTICPEMPTI